MLPKKNRNTKMEFDSIFTQGKKIFSPFFHVSFLPSEDRRFSVVVSKKLVRSAFSRNRQKRRVFAVIKKNLHQLPQVAALVIVKKNISHLEPQDLEKELMKLLNKCR
jgi:ribonuclease P protein component